MDNHETILQVKNISKRFPGVKALSEVNIDIRRGEIHALVGENGAGKSTLIKILSGVYQPEEGEVYFKGEKVQFRNPLEAQKKGISVVHQEIKLCENLTVAENIFLGRPKVSKGVKLVDWKGLRTEAQELLSSINADLNVDSMVSRLSVAKKQMVEICKALSYNAELIIMDEPSATLTEKELDFLFDVMHTLKERGVTIIYISHRLEEIFQLADRVTILRDGCHVATKDIHEVDRNSLIAMMVGRELGNEYPKTDVQFGEKLLELKNIQRGSILRDINMYVRRGEILGISGLVGAGRTELARVIFGADQRTGGEILIDGKPVTIKSVVDGIGHRIALVPEDRKQQGANLIMSIKHNISLVGIDRVLSGGFISSAKENSLADEFIDKLSIATPDRERRVMDLSGGNQQKVVLSKWLAVDSDILLFDEPTRGIDVGAKAEIYKLLCDLASKGKAVIMISSEMPELMGMCDRMYIMYEGRISGELNRSEFTQERIMAYASGVTD